MVVPVCFLPERYSLLPPWSAAWLGNFLIFDSCMNMKGNISDLMLINFHMKPFPEKLFGTLGNLVFLMEQDPYILRKRITNLVPGFGYAVQQKQGDLP